MYVGVSIVEPDEQPKGGVTYIKRTSVQVTRSARTAFKGLQRSLTVSNLRVMATLLNAETVARLLDEVPNWRLAGDAIERTVTCKDFSTAISFVNQVAAEAEAVSHHPDIDIRWNKVRLVLTTHSAQGLTDLDFTLARKLDAIAEPFAHTASAA